MAQAINQPDATISEARTVSSSADVAGCAMQFDGEDWLSFAMTGLLVLAVYLFTLAPDVTLTNTGYFATAAKTAGVPSPPGYPLWTIYSWVFTWLLPVSNIAWRVSVGSAVAAALACGMVALCVSGTGKLLMEDAAGFDYFTSQERKRVRIVCGYVAGMALGLSGIVWHKALIADIWTLSLFLFTAIICLSIRWITEPGRKRFLCAGFLLLGVLLTSSQELIVALPGLVFIAMLGDRNLGRDLALTVLPLAGILTWWNEFGLWIDFPGLWNWPSLIAFAAVAALGLTIMTVTRRFGSKWKFALLCGGSIFLGLSLCFCLPIASMNNPPMNWGYPRTVEGFCHVLSRGQYERVHPTADPGQYANQLCLFVKMSGKELGWGYLLLAAVPACAILRIHQRARKWVFALAMMFVCSGPVLVAEISSSPDRNSQELVMFYFIPSFAALSVLAGMGLMLCIRPLGGRTPRLTRS